MALKRAVVVGLREGASVVAAIAALAATASAGQQTAVLAPCQSAAAAACQERHYRLAARIRPLFFWIGRDNVGEARLTWQAGDGGGRGYSLLIGSDPARAPRKINKWGYISELEEGAAVRVFGLMTQRFPRRPRPEAGLRLPPGTEPGFLFAMSSLLREHVEAVHRDGAPVIGARRAYVYNNRLYVVVTRSSRLLKRVTIKGRAYDNVIESEFEARAATKGIGSTYRIVYGTHGALREVPVRVVYRPNFWFEAEIVLADEVPSAWMPDRQAW
jgi:hypothetical protein